MDEQKFTPENLAALLSEEVAEVQVKPLTIQEAKDVFDTE